VPADEIFTEYAQSLRHGSSTRQYAEIWERLQLGPGHLMLELASTTYLLQAFVGAGSPILGIDPTANVAKAAQEGRAPTLSPSSAWKMLTDGRRIRPSSRP
jgi:hypothetical protein